MAAQNRYDGTLQMFVEEQRAPDQAQLRFLRWLAERGHLEHPVAGAPCGALCVSQARTAPDLRAPFSTAA